jgi:sugar/nucleoside kinase (ribokinase family)
VITALSAEGTLSLKFVEDLTSRGIALCASLRPFDLPKQNILIEASGERTFKGYQPGVLADWVLNKLQVDTITTADVVVTLAFQQIMPLFEQVIALPLRGKLSIDFMDMADFGKDFSRIERYLQLCDLAFFGLSKQSDRELITKIKQWFSVQQSEKIAVMTFGPEGSVAVGPGFFFEQGVDVVREVVDTTGAGDSFAGAFLANYLAGKSIPDAMRAGSQRAAAVVQKIGGY